MKIICIGRNYKKHAIELGNNIPDEPLFFLKPDTAIQPKGHPFFIPHSSNHIDYEVELVLKIQKTGKHIEEKYANRYYSEIGLGVDFTARDIQKNAKKKACLGKNQKVLMVQHRLVTVLLIKMRLISIKSYLA